MKQLQLDNSAARRLYPTAAPEFKEMLEQSFGKDFFSMKITDRLKSFADVLDQLGMNLSCVVPYPSPVNDRQIAVNAVEKAFLAVQAINEGWIPDYDNSSQPKYEIWWDMRNGRLVFNCVYYWRSNSRVGSRLCFKSAELARWAAQQKWFVDICEQYMVQNTNCKSIK